MMQLFNPWTRECLEIGGACYQTFPCKHIVSSGTLFSASTIFDQMFSLLMNQDYRKDLSKILNFTLPVSGIVYDFLFMVDPHFLYMFEYKNKEEIHENAKNNNLDYFVHYSEFVTPRMFEDFAELNMDPKFLFEFGTRFNIPFTIDTARQAIKHQQLDWLNYLINENDRRINPFQSTSAFYLECGPSLIHMAHFHKNSNQKTVDILLQQADNFLKDLFQGQNDDKIIQYLRQFPSGWFYSFKSGTLPKLTMEGKTRNPRKIDIR